MIPPPGFTVTWILVYSLLITSGLLLLKYNSYLTPCSSAYVNKEIVKSVGEDMIVIYNRVPKTGSTSFVNIAYDMLNKNKFNVIHVNTSKNSHTLSYHDQKRFAENVTNWKERLPAFYHGHFGFINFQKFGIRQPIYINILREPLERFLSYYYFLRYGDNFRPHLIRSRHGSKMTFDECVEINNDDCNPTHMWLQIPFLCGQNPKCWEPGNAWALQEAKRNLISNYLLVGITDDLVGFVSILESVLPSYFGGATHHFISSPKRYLRKTNKKIKPAKETIMKIKNSSIYQMENELYEFAAYNFNGIKKHMIPDSHGKLVSHSQFTFGKIAP